MISLVIVIAIKAEWVNSNLRLLIKLSRALQNSRTNVVLYLMILPIYLMQLKFHHHHHLISLKYHLILRLSLIAQITNFAKINFVVTMFEFTAIVTIEMLLIMHSISIAV
jgi:hypothetical protein